MYWNILDLKDLVFGGRDNDDQLMIKQQNIGIGFIRSLERKQGYSKQENINTMISMINSQAAAG